MTDRQITSEERYLISLCRTEGMSASDTASLLQRHRSTIYRELARNRSNDGSYDSRGRLAGKRQISEKPASVEERSEVGHWEIDTVMGSPDQHCIVILVERKTGLVEIGKLRRRTKEATNRRAIDSTLEQEHPVHTGHRRPRHGV